MIFKLKKYIIPCFSLLLLTSCMDDLQEINTDSELMPTTKPEYMFTEATKNFLNSSRDHLTGLYGGSLAQMQYLTSKSGVENNGHFLDPTEISGRSVYSPAWGDYYGNRGRNLRELIKEVARRDESEQLKYKSLVAICQILEIYQAWLALETHGAMPYHEAFLGRDENLNEPKYDYIWDLYKHFDEKLKESSATLTTATGQIVLGNQDFFFQGDYVKWAKFANAFRLRTAMRMQKADPEFFETVLAEVGNEGMLPSSNEESCFYRHPKDHNNDVNDINQVWQSYQTTKAFVEFLKRSEDPRLRLMIRGNEFRQDLNKYKQALAKYPEIANTTWATDNYWGAPVSPKAVQDTLNWIRGIVYKNCPKLDDPSKFDDITLRPSCLIQGRYFVKNGGYKDGEDDDQSSIELRKSGDAIKMKTALITYADVCFMLAECALTKGSIAGKTANNWYQDGIHSSIQMYQTLGEEIFVPAAVNSPITSEEIHQFLNSDYGKLSGSIDEQKEMILSQMWVHSLKNSDEMYAQWKRTGYPKFEEESPYKFAAILEQPYSNTGIRLVMPRRRNLPSSTLNPKERDIALRNLMKGNGVPTYGEELETKGRIWWDR